MTWYLKGRIAEPEEVATTRQWSSKHAPAATDMHAAVEELLEAVFSVQSVPMLMRTKRTRQ
jgi:hypothetical protein